MQDSWFWRAVACVGLVAALGYVASRFTSETTVHAQAGSVMAVAERESELPRLYLVDTSRKVILVYGGGARFRFTLLASRYYEVDSQATVGREFPFAANGYPIQKMQIYAKQPVAR